ncbi:serine protease [Kitasatospora sp. MAP5-34]|uniref:trypsin-like serine peptidase n=1 Tax=Kitasatospora sp. MAP5-34 TaxID=3035102 RepID=UPI002474A6E8|nr:serine protease [Kitasatospora sp. MAP5-34]
MHRRPVVLTSVLALAVVGGVIGIGTLAGEATAFTAHAPAAKTVAPAPRTAAPSTSPSAAIPSAASAAPAPSAAASAAPTDSSGSGSDVARPGGNSVGSTASDSAQAVAPTALGSTATAAVTAESSRVGALFAGAVAAGNHSCTASVLHSSTKNLILTAAHCIVTPDGLSFAPAYHDGQTPYGSWPVTKVYTTTGWSQGGDPDEDFAILQVGQNGGRDIEDVVGGNVLGLQAGFSTVVRLYGYPDTSEVPLLCTNSTSRQDTYQRRIDCPSYASGTSGGPWIDTDTNQVVGVIGGYQQGGDTDDTSYSAYFDHTIDDLYQQAVTGSG